MWNKAEYVLMQINRHLAGEGTGDPLQYSCLENPMGGGAWQVAVHGVAKSWIRLSDFTFSIAGQYFPGGLDGQESAWGLKELYTTEQNACNAGDPV